MVRLEDAREYASSSNAAPKWDENGILWWAGIGHIAVFQRNQDVRKIEAKVTALEGQLREAQQDRDSERSIKEAEKKILISEVEKNKRLQEALQDAIGAKNGWRIRAGKVLGAPKQKGGAG